MNKIFKTGGSGKKIHDVVDYIRTWINKDDGKYEIWIGCDSQPANSFCHYATAIVIYKEGKGGHVIYCKHKEEFERVYDSVKQRDYAHVKRLDRETEHVMEVALYLKEHMPELNGNLEVHFDFNNEPKHLSNRCLNWSVGWAKSVGLKYSYKPDGWSATGAADHYLRN